ncbi:hypothetical protein HYQ19_gp070 [Arthrobacter phage DrYang]|uniref:Uncharacterized protein n=1 Tax=Arthrobacter phage DrYang TaxID=2686080 RepID=A0A6B9JBU4_9CAUD|nr:hypothetical protein HYQ19_gp070 [Arthrobacter phage DrYang]QGZ17169.1 hypothetical protein SEA_DRYANG_70 [Arthrobacter phage DrYang]
MAKTPHRVVHLTKCYDCATLVEEPVRGAFEIALCAKHRDCVGCPIRALPKKQAQVLTLLDYDNRTDPEQPQAA